jgi:hypothetical protein
MTAVVAVRRMAVAAEERPKAAVAAVVRRPASVEAARLQAVAVVRRTEWAARVITKTVITSRKEPPGPPVVSGGSGPTGRPVPPADRSGSSRGSVV